jgi:uncharacterized membrane protein
LKTTQIIDKTVSMKPRAANRIADFGLIMVSGFALLALIGLAELAPSWASWLAPLRILLGLAFMLYVPGYLLQVLLYPRRGDLDSVERLGLSIGLSIALVPLTALLLDYLPWGLHFWPIVLGQSLLVLLLLLAALARRLSLPATETYEPVLHPRVKAWWRNLELVDRRLYLLAGGALLLAVIALAWVYFVPPPNEFMTEFYMLGKSGLAEDYPREIAAGQVVSITIGISNREEVISTYNILVKLGDQVIGRAGPMTLENNAIWEQPMEFSIPEVGEDQQVMFILEREGQQSPYRTLRLWINVKLAQIP